MCARGRSDAPAACTGWMHADLYPGNFLLLPGGRLGMVDSGAAAATPGGIPAPFGQLAAAVLGGDGPTAIQLGSGPSLPARPGERAQRARQPRGRVSVGLPGQQPEQRVARLAPVLRRPRERGQLGRQPPGHVVVLFCPN